MFESGEEAKFAQWVAELQPFFLFCVCQRPASLTCPYTVSDSAQFGTLLCFKIIMKDPTCLQQTFSWGWLLIYVCRHLGEGCMITTQRQVGIHDNMNIKCRREGSDSRRAAVLHQWSTWCPRIWPPAQSRHSLQQRYSGCVGAALGILGLERVEELKDMKSSRLISEFNKVYWLSISKGWLFSENNLPAAVIWRPVILHCWAYRCSVVGVQGARRGGRPGQ